MTKFEMVKAQEGRVKKAAKNMAEAATIGTEEEKRICFAILEEAEASLRLMYTAIEKLDSEEAEAKVANLADKARIAYLERRKQEDEAMENADDISTPAEYLDKHDINSINRRFKMV